MAKNNSFIKLEGTLDGLTFYEKDGENFVKTKSTINKNRIQNDPAFARTRENMQEFGGAAKVGKAYREAFGSIVKLMGDTYIASRLAGAMKRINRNGAGLRGQRDFDIVGNADLLVGFNFDEKTPLGAQFFAPYDKPTLNANRDVATWTVPDFNTDNFITKPEGATHCRLVLASGLLSNYQWESALASYEPVNEDENSKGDVAYSADISLQGDVGAVTTLTVDLGIGAALPATVANLVSIGIIFYQEINGQLYELASGNAMKLVVVG